MGVGRNRRQERMHGVDNMDTAGNSHQKGLRVDGVGTKYWKEQRVQDQRGGGGRQRYH